MIPWRARLDRRPEYQTAVKMEGLAKGYGDVTVIKAPDHHEYGKFETIGSFRGEEDRVSTTLTGIYAADIASELMALAKVGCPVDVQLHIGACTDPSAYDDFTKAVILEDVLIASYSTDPLGALAPDEKAKVNETVDITAAEFYEVLPLNTMERAGDVVINEVIDVIFCDTISCGECEDQSAGCNKAFALTKAEGGSPGTPADVVFTLDGAATFLAHDIDTLLSNEEPDAIACVGTYIVVVSNDTCSLHYVLRSQFDGHTDPAFTEIGTGFVGCPNDIWSVGAMAFVVGDRGYIYECTDPTAGVTVLDAGVAVVDALLAVHAMSDRVAVAVGNNGAVVYTLDGIMWQATATRPVGVGINLLCVWVRGEREWLVGSSGGRLYYTFDQGVTWHEKTFPGSGAGAVQDICFSTDSVGYLSHTLSGKGRVLRTYNGGYSWVFLPEASGIIPAADRFTALAACIYDPNVVLAVGLADNAVDGIIVVGED
jgi:hypothetical protein